MSERAPRYRSRSAWEAHVRSMAQPAVEPLEPDLVQILADRVQVLGQLSFLARQAKSREDTDAVGHKALHVATVLASELVAVLGFEPVDGGVVSRPRPTVERARAYSERARS